MGVTGMTHATVNVVVEDSASKPVGSASVTLRAAPRKAGISVAEGSLGNYSATGLQPGSYTLEVLKQGFLKESYSITLNEGRNSTQVVLGKRGEPWFYAAGRKIYFERVPDQFLIAAQGDNAARITEDRVGPPANERRAEAFSREAESRPPRDSSFVRVSTPGAKRPDDLLHALLRLPV